MKLSKKNVVIDRAINEFRCGRPIAFNLFNNKLWVFFPLENINLKFLLDLNKNTSNHKSRIVTFLTDKKFSSLINIVKKVKSHDKMKNYLEFPITDKNISWLKSIHTRKLNKSDIIKFKKFFLSQKKSIKEIYDSKKIINNIIDLTKNAKIIPCLIGFNVNPSKLNNSIMIFDSKEIRGQNKLIVNSTKMISESYIPLEKDKKAKIIIFKSFIGGLEHTVLKIGKIKEKKIINLRIQSACLTGEVFHSMKCDCREQLHQSIDYLSKNGGGYIVHLQQEGRGIGLANKIRAYDLQNKGMDTYDADINIGFLGEERDFDIAAKILKYFEIKKVNIITNNNDKIKSLKNNNIKINKIIPTRPTINKFNQKYLSARVKKTKYSISFD